jgi:hypothetical protein
MKGLYQVIICTSWQHKFKNFMLHILYVGNHFCSENNLAFCPALVSQCDLLPILLSYNFNEEGENKYVIWK